MRGNHCETRDLRRSHQQCWIIAQCFLPTIKRIFEPALCLQVASQTVELLHRRQASKWGDLLKKVPLPVGGAKKKEHQFADYLMHFEMIYSHFWQNQTTLGLSDVRNKFAPLSFYVCHTNILGFEAFLSSEIWFGLSYSITIAAFCMPNILVYQDQESVHK